jgi:hypothetical protein
MRSWCAGNAIWLPAQETWSLIDFGCTEQCGAHSLACSFQPVSDHHCRRSKPHIILAACSAMQHAPSLDARQQESSCKVGSAADGGARRGAGKEAGLSFSLLYAAPETVAAFIAGRRDVVADTAVDTFAFGIMCFELLTRAPFYPEGLRGSDVGDMLAGRRPLPHESMAPEVERKLGTLKQCAPRPLKPVMPLAGCIRMQLVLT